MQLPQVGSPHQQVCPLQARQRQRLPDRQLAHAGQRGQGAQRWHPAFDALTVNLHIDGKAHGAVFTKPCEGHNSRD